MSRKVNIVAVVPAYNEEMNIAKVVLRAKRFADEVIVCDDGSTDMTSTIAKALGANVIRHREKLGKGEALRTLFKEVMPLGSGIIVTIDGDGQHDPDDIPILLKPIEAGETDIVVGSRYIQGGKMDAPLYRRLGLRVINFMYRKTAGINIKDTQSGFRAYSKKAVEYLFSCYSKGYGVEGEQLMLASKNGIRVMEVPISIKYKGLPNKSKKNPILHGIELVTTLSRLLIEDRPIFYLGIPGTIFMAVGILSGLYSLWVFNVSRHFSIPAVLLAVGTLIPGLLLAISAVVLHGLNRIDQKLKDFVERENQHAYS